MYRTLLLLFLLVIPGFSNGFTPHRELRIELTEQLSLYYKKLGYDRDPKEFRPFMFSAIRVAKMFPMYSDEGEQDRMLRLFALGGLESFWKENFIIINVPGANYSNGRVKRVSVDFSAWGLNESNVEWTYAVAKHLQETGKIPKKVKGWYSYPEFAELLRGAKIPKEIKLRRIDLKVAKDYKKDYYNLKPRFRDQEKLRKIMTQRAPLWLENTQDDIDSALIYRVLVELDRKARGWNYGQDQYKDSKHEAYRYLKQFIDVEK